MGKSNNITTPKILVSGKTKHNTHQAQLTTSRKEKILEFYHGLGRNPYDDNGKLTDLLNPIWKQKLKVYLDDSEVSVQDITRWLKMNPSLRPTGLDVKGLSQVETRTTLHGAVCKLHKQSIEHPEQVNEISSTISHAHYSKLKRNQYQIASDTAQSILDSMLDVPSNERDYLYRDAVAALKSIQRIVAPLHNDQQGHYNQISEDTEVKGGFSNLEFQSLDVELSPVCRFG